MGLFEVFGESIGRVLIDLGLFGVCNLTTVCVTHNTPSASDLLKFPIQRATSSDYIYVANVRVQNTVVTDISCHYA